MKLPRKYLCAWKNVVATFLASVGITARGDQKAKRREARRALRSRGSEKGDKSHY
jgi:hypothetical protein